MSKKEIINKMVEVYDIDSHEAVLIYDTIINAFTFIYECFNVIIKYNNNINRIVKKTCAGMDAKCHLNNVP